MRARLSYCIWLITHSWGRPRSGISRIQERFTTIRVGGTYQQSYAVCAALHGFMMKGLLRMMRMNSGIGQLRTVAAVLRGRQAG